MKVSYSWLQEHIEQKLPDAKSLAQEIIFHAFEVEGIEERNGDTVMEIKVLPDRAGDCLSHVGIAREVSGLLGFKLKEKKFPALPAIEQKIPVELQSDLCRTYLAVRIDGVKVGPSPEWLRTKLETLGQKSINNVVDATNVVLFDSGQPVHAFDAAKVDGGIVVRLANEGESIKLLGGEEKLLKNGDLVIADYMGALAIAGVKGGQAAEVTEATTSIIIEVANFDPSSVRKTSRRLGLITDASKRFENNLSPIFALPAMEQVVAIIQEIAGGTISAIGAQGKAADAARTLSFSLSDITRLLGGTITTANIEEVFARYSYEYKKDGERFTLGIPHRRADLIGAHDIAEEVGRVIGYDKIPASALPFTPIAQPNEADIQMSAVRAWCIAQGYREVYTYAFRPKGEVSVAYGAKGKDKLRANLSDGLKESYELNRLNAPLFGASEVKLFEIGTVFFADKEEMRVATCDRGTIQELPLADFIKEKNIDGSAPQLPSGSGLPSSPFVPWSPYPFITRDLAVWVDGAEPRVKLTRLVGEFATRHCVRPAQLFDEFSKDGKTSIAYRFVFQSPERTLTDGEVTKTFSQLMQSLGGIDGIVVR